jgi:hypothetical protein
LAPVPKVKPTPTNPPSKTPTNHNNRNNKGISQQNVPGPNGLSFAHIIDPKTDFNTPPPLPKNKPSVGNTLNDSIHANESWADETEAELSHRHDNKYQPSLFDSISTQLVNISQQLADIQNQLGFTLTRVNTINTVLNITSISPEQADIINNNKYKNPLDDMEEEDNEVVTAGIDISKSIVRQ